MKEVEKKIRENFNQAFENALVDENQVEEDDDEEDLDDETEE